MPALKDHVDLAMLEALAAELAVAWPDFPAAAFIAEAGDGLDRLELKDRIRQVAAALEHAVAGDAADPTAGDAAYATAGDEPDPTADAVADATAVPTADAAARAVAVLDGALASPGFRGWMVWPCAELLGRLGPDHPDVVLPAMARLTHRSSCEFAIRACIERHPTLTFAHLERWVDHPDEHVRRLVSEGTRPRLPWGARLRALQQDPAPTIALLDRLRDDSSEYVRRSVANHLGDIAKDHPDLALDVAARWKREGGRHIDDVVRHGLRALIKAGHPDALALVGYDRDAPVRLTHLAIDPDRLPIGGQATLTVRLEAPGDQPVPVVVEYRVHFLGPRGPRKPRAFRMAERTLEPGVPTELRRRHTFDHASIRTLHPGEHRIDVQVNGRVLASTTLELLP